MIVRVIKNSTMSVPKSKVRAMADNGWCQKCLQNLGSVLKQVQPSIVLHCKTLSDMYNNYLVIIINLYLIFFWRTDIPVLKKIMSGYIIQAGIKMILLYWGFLVHIMFVLYHSPVMEIWMNIKMMHLESHHNVT